MSVDGGIGCKKTCQSRWSLCRPLVHQIRMHPNIDITCWEVRTCSHRCVLPLHRSDSTQRWSCTWHAIVASSKLLRRAVLVMAV